MKLQNRTLFFGDNLEILTEKIPPESFDLIYLDPPFNSDRNYNVLFKEGKVDSSAQIHAFEDTWEWTDTTVHLFEGLKAGPNPKVAILVSSLWEFLGPTPMMAYLVNMSARLLPLHTVLKETGSLYLHCDPTASHYLKIILDVIFGGKNFKNEVIWHYRRWTGKARMFQKLHDVILFYTKTDNYKFNEQFTEYTEGSKDRKLQGVLHRFKGDEAYLVSEKSIDEKGVRENDVWQIPFIAPSARERLGYPTQKPEALLEKIIKASSDEGDWVLDPFCGCGTTVAVAERLHRNWVGIDISMQAINVIKERLNAHFSGIKVNIDGIPQDYEAAQSLAAKDKFSFQDWAISLVGAYPPSGETKRGADRGIDGLILFNENINTEHPQLRKIIVQVKGGNTSRHDVATLKGDADRENAPMGILITLDEPTTEMKREAALSGEYRYSNSVSFPKIQLLSVKDWFDGQRASLPTDKVISPFKRADAKVDQTALF
jgi:site-specific DNA-methyltransferase (adenine-specific)